MILRPKAAVERCLEIYRSDPDLERRLWAAEALSWTADGDALPVVQELLADPEPAMQRSGAYLLDQLLWTGLAHPHLAEPLLLLAEEHPNPDVRGTASNIWEYLERRGVQRSPTKPDDPTLRCAICGEELGGSPSVRWASVPGLAWHLSCEAAAGGQAWFERLRKEHPALDRQVKLRTLDLHQDCGSCGAHHSVSPTATGHDPSGWSVNCSGCGNVWVEAVDADRQPDLFAELMRLRLNFEVGNWSGLQEWMLAALDARLPGHANCSDCGGRFSCAARSRCRVCRAVLGLDSWLHTAAFVQPTHSTLPGRDAGR